MAKKSYNYAQLEAVAQEMRANADMVFFYEYQTPTATLPTGEVLDLAKEFGEHRTSGRGWPIDASISPNQGTNASKALPPLVRASSIARNSPPRSSSSPITPSITWTVTR